MQSHQPVTGADLDVQPAAAPPSIRREWQPLALLTLWFVGASVAIGVLRNVPVLDDWTYAWSVEQLLLHGRFELLDWSAVYPLGHTVWGAAWTAIFGFSFATLRVSTLVMALLGCGALYLILRELEAPRPLALLGTLTMAANPSFLLLSSSFMTDVPFVALTLASLLCYIRGIRRQDDRFLWWGGAWAFAAFLQRQIGIITPLAAVPLLFLPPNRHLRRSTVVIALSITWAAMVAGSYEITALVRPTGEMTKLMDRLSYVLDVPVLQYVGYNLYVLSTMTFYALPALLAMAAVRGLWRRRSVFLVAAALGALMLAVIGEIPVPLRSGNTWTLMEIGGSRGLINGIFPMTDTPWIEIALRGLGLAAGALTMFAIVRGIGVDVAAARTASGERARRILRAAITSPRAPLVLYLAGYLLVANVLWMYNDRYLLILLPLFVALALGAPVARMMMPQVRLGWSVAAIVAVVAVIGTRDALRFNEAIRDTWQTMVNSGVRPSDIDAGYAWTGWVLYAHPENLTSGGMTIRDVPWITSKRKAKYILSKTRLDGYDVAREVTWSDDAPWPGPDRFLVLEQPRTP